MTTCYLSPIGNNTQTSTSGAPLSGGLIYTYQAGTSTPQATYMDNTGSVGQSNPIVLNTYGLPANPIWLVGGQAYKFVIKDALGNIIRTIDNIGGVNDVLKGPAFSASQSVAQSIANSVPTKIQLQIKEFDFGNCFDNTTNYRFTPTVGGVYQISGSVGLTSSAALLCSQLFKNGGEVKRGGQSGSAANTGSSSEVSALVQFNGTTDYVELFVFQASGGALNTNAGSTTFLQAALVRAA